MKYLVAVLAAFALSTPVISMACPGKGDKADNTASKLLQQSEARSSS